jgi:hypothetical protein
VLLFTSETRKPSCSKAPLSISLKAFVCSEARLMRCANNATPRLSLIGIWRVVRDPAAMFHNFAGHQNLLRQACRLASSRRSRSLLALDCDTQCALVWVVRDLDCPNYPDLGSLTIRFQPAVHEWSELLVLCVSSKTESGILAAAWS